jgi:hypothetical protein
MSLFALIALGRVDWGKCVLVPSLLWWLVMAGVVGWCFYSVVVLFSNLEKSKPPAHYLILLGAIGVLLVGWLILREWASASWDSGSPRARVREFAFGFMNKLPPQPNRVAFCLYLELVEGEWPIPVPYNVTNGPWIVWEKAMIGFAQSNRIQLLGFWNADNADPSVVAYVGVRHKDARAMRRFLRSMGQSANNGSAANRSQPIRSETNQTSSAAASGR